MNTLEKLIGKTILRVEETEDQQYRIVFTDNTTATISGGVSSTENTTPFLIYVDQDGTESYHEA